jgi:CRP-like cAMP-binding protein
VDRLRTEETIRELEVDIRCLRSEAFSSMFVVVSGALAVLCTSPDGRTAQIGTLQRGHAFGDLTSVLGLRRDTTISCVEDTVLAEFTRKDVASVLDGHPGVKKDLQELVGFAETQMVRTDAVASLKCVAASYDEQQVSC